MTDLAQPWSQSWYPTMMANLAKLVGWGSPGADGQDMPNLSAIDTVALLGVVTPSLVSAIVRFNQQANGSDAAHVGAPVSALDSTGMLVFSGDPNEVTNPSGDPTQATDPNTATTFIDVNTYLQYQPANDGTSGNASWERWGPDFISGYAPWYSNTVIANGYPAILMLVRQAIADWQRMVAASSSCLLIASANATSPADMDSLSEFMSALRALCSDFDVLNESPAKLDGIADALRDALGKTSEFIGRTAADIAGEVGKQAGIIGAGFSGGFLENAGVLSIIVVGIIVHLFLAR